MHNLLFSNDLESLSTSDELVTQQYETKTAPILKEVTRLRRVFLTRDKRTLEDKDVKKLGKVIGETFGMNIKLVTDKDPTGWTITPRLKRPNILNGVKARKVTIPDLSKYNLTFILDDHLLIRDGKVFPREAMVGGAFSKVEVTIGIGFVPFFGALALNDREITAVILHEVGHSFNVFRLLHRTSVSNEVINDIIRMDASDVPIGEIITKIKRNKDSGIAKASNGEGGVQELVTRLALAQGDSIQSIIRENTFDDNNSESLANLFASRLGYGKEIVSSISKINKVGSHNTIARGGTFSEVTLLQFGTFVNVVFAPVLGFSSALKVMGMTSVHHDTNATPGQFRYDSYRIHVMKTLNQMTDRLKNLDLSNQAKRDLISDMDEIRESLDSVPKDDFPVANEIGKYYNRKDLASNQAHVFQLIIEKLLNNPLFKEATRLSVGE